MNVQKMKNMALLLAKKVAKKRYGSRAGRANEPAEKGISASRRENEYYSINWC